MESSLGRYGRVSTSTGLDPSLRKFAASAISVGVASEADRFRVQIEGEGLHS